MIVCWENNKDKTSILVSYSGSKREEMDEVEFVIELIKQHGSFTRVGGFQNATYGDHMSFNAALINEAKLSVDQKAKIVQELITYGMKFHEESVLRGVVLFSL